MISLIISLISTVGPAGIGAGLKLFSGLLQNRSDFKLAQIAAGAANTEAFQSIFKQDGMSKASANTRRILAVIIMTTCSVCAILGMLWSKQEFVTFIIPEMKQGFKVLWGFISIPSTKELTVKLTLGHLSLMFMSIGSMTAGFYFTPSGRK